jgi:hypothetical protein
MKTARKTDVDDDDMLPEYDFSTPNAVRGGFPELTGCGSFRLWSELHPHFDTSDQVDAALTQWVAEHRPPRQRRRARIDPRTPDARFVGAKTGLVCGFWFARDLVPFFPTEKSVNEALREWVAEHKKRKQRVRA